MSVLIVFLLIVIALLLWFIYRHLTKEDRATAKLEKYLAKQALQEKDWTVDSGLPKQETLSDQIEKYHKVHKTWKWRK
jgi:cbb3-type cytochrome oxidase subunit 3